MSVADIPSPEAASGHDRLCVSKQPGKTHRHYSAPGHQPGERPGCRTAGSLYVFGRVISARHAPACAPTRQMTRLNRVTSAAACATVFAGEECCLICQRRAIFENEYDNLPKIWFSDKLDPGRRGNASGNKNLKHRYQHLGRQPSRTRQSGQIFCAAKDKGRNIRTSRQFHYLA